MACTINASATNGIVQTADGSGIVKLQSAGVTTNALAWVNFNGTGTVAIRSSYNVSSITDNGTGNYNVNFTIPMADANYAVISTAWTASSQILVSGGQVNLQAPTTSLCRIRTNNGGALGGDTTAGDTDAAYVFVAIFGN